MRMEDASDHTSQQFAVAIDHVRDLVVKMGGLAEERVATVVKALSTRDEETARIVEGSDHQINALELQIDEECANILALRQPVARDLRLVIVVLKVITDLERVGDEAQRIAKQLLELGRTEIPPVMQRELDRLGKHASDMLRKALDSFVRSQTGAISELKVQDRKVDSEFNSVMDAFETAVSERTATVQSLLNVLWCARSLERIGDHAKNIGEYVVYLAKGKDIRHNSPAAS